LDTIKTQLQTRGATNIGQIVRTLGLRGLYRGSVPVLIGGSAFRSAQFGVFESVLSLLPPREKGRAFSWQTAVAGLGGGFGRGMVEAPAEFIKVRLQIAEPWRFSQVYRGSGVTLLRNSFLFGSFVLYLDLTNYAAPNLPPFFKGALCANMAWLGIWPLDVVKSQRQSGLFEGRSSLSLLKQLLREGKLFTGLLPGLMRSSVANGCGMWAYTQFVKAMKERA
jgi:solute carrier family 25 carnitine/acylcarnitine transporter 20/29